MIEEPSTAVSAGPPADPLEQHETALADVQLADFRAANLFQLVRDRLRPGTLLDVGCGPGGLVASLLQEGRDARGVDTSAPIVAAGQRFFARMGLDPARIEVRSPEAVVAAGRQYDNVVCMDCLEHVEDDRALLANLVALVAPAGRLVITVPALPWLYGPRDVAIGHYRRYSRQSLLALLDGQPVARRALRYWNVLGVVPTYVTGRLLNRRIDESFRFGRPTWRRRLLRRALNGWFGTVERHVALPLGLTLVLVVDRR